MNIFIVSALYNHKYVFWITILETEPDQHKQQKIFLTRFIDFQRRQCAFGTLFSIGIYKYTKEYKKQKKKMNNNNNNETWMLYLYSYNRNVWEDICRQFLRDIWLLLFSLSSFYKICFVNSIKCESRERKVKKGKQKAPTSIRNTQIQILALTQSHFVIDVARLFWWICQTKFICIKTYQIN